MFPATCRIESLKPHAPFPLGWFAMVFAEVWGFGSLEVGWSVLTGWEYNDKHLSDRESISGGLQSPHIGKGQVKCQADRGVFITGSHKPFPMRRIQTVGQLVHVAAGHKNVVDAVYRMRCSVLKIAPAGCE